MYCYGTDKRGGILTAVIRVLRKGLTALIVRIIGLRVLIIELRVLRMGLTALIVRIIGTYGDG